jgi:hypothetical protein
MPDDSAQFAHDSAFIGRLRGTQPYDALMTSRFLIWFLLFGSCALPHSILSQVAHAGLGQDETETRVMVARTRSIMAANGRAWKSLDPQSKVAWLVGIEDGVTLLFKELFDEGNSEPTQRVLDAVTIPGFRQSDIAKQMDSFYSDSANVRIPVLEAYRYSLLKMKGKKASDLEEVLVGLRQTYNQ